MLRRSRNKPSALSCSYKSRHQRFNYPRIRFQWAPGLWRRFVTARLLRPWVRMPPGAWIFVCCECCMLSGRALCDELITRPEESHWLWCVVVCDLETSGMRRPWPALGRNDTEEKSCIKLVVTYALRYLCKSCGVAAYNANIGGRWKWWIRSTPSPLYRGTEPQ
jgi:hypothetical protein